MPTVSLTTFIDFVVASGTSRITRVRRAKERYLHPYDPAADFYKRVRNGIVEYHKSGAALETVLEEVTDKKKRKIYPDCIKGYRKWMGRRQFKWVQPAHPVLWESGKLMVRVNPELGLISGDDEYLIKLYFKADELSKSRVDTMLHLIQATLTQDSTPLRPGILDVQRGKLFEPTIEVAGTEVLLVGEAAAFVSMWDGIRI